MEKSPESADPLSDPPGVHFVRSALFFYGAMAIVAVLWRTGLNAEPIFFTSAAEAALEVPWLRDLALGTGVGLAVVLLSTLATRNTQWGEKLARAIGESLGPISTPDAILLAFASGLGEEMLFRGALQPRVGLVAASILFGIAHFVPRREFLPWTVYALLVGFLFGLLFEATGNLVAPIAAHAVVNGINLPLLTRQYAPPQQPS